jgi:hypothetical protein
MGSFIGGGTGNNAPGTAVGYASILGGFENNAAGDYSSVLGGYGNSAAGTSSVVSGTSASDNGIGTSFVWADSGGITIPDDANADSVWFAAGTSATSGAVYTIYTTADRSVAATLDAGASTWNLLADSVPKENMKVLDGGKVLDSLKNVPIYSYNHHGSAHTSHGPTAKEWRTAFPASYGKNTESVSTGDVVGVSLAAIKELIARVESLSTRCAALESR